MKRGNYYQLLGINMGASQEVLKKAFRSQIAGVHPDHNPNDQNALERTRILIEAYKTLSNPHTRKQYDMALMPAVYSAIAPVKSSRQVMPPLIYRIITSLLAIGLIVFLTIIITQIILGYNMPSFKPAIADMQAYGTPKTIPILPDPSVYDCIEWYYTQEYKLSLADDWARNEVINAYSKAFTQAVKRGERSTAKFYKSSISKVNSSEPNWCIK